MKGHRIYLSLTLLLLTALACRLVDDLASGADSEDISPVTTTVPVIPDATTTTTESRDENVGERPSGDAALRRYEDPVLGIQFDYPAEWLVEPGDVALTIAPDLEALNDPAQGARSVAIISIQPDSILRPVDLTTLTPDLVFEVKELEQTRAPIPLTINGHEASMGVYSGTVAGKTRSFVVYGISGPSQAVLLLGATPEDSPDVARIEAIAESVVLRAAQPPPTPVATGTLARGEARADAVGDGERAVLGFEGVAGEYVGVVVETEGEFDAVVDVVGADGRSLVDGVVDETYDTERIEGIHLPADGSYFVVIRGFGLLGGAFRVTVNDDGPPAGGPQPSDNLALLADGIAYRATLPDDSVHDYRFEAEAQEPVTLIVAADAGFDAVITVFNAQSVELAEVDVAFDGEAESLLFVPPVDGDYIVRVSGFLNAGGQYLIGLVTMNDSPTAVVETAGFVTRTSDGSHDFTLEAGQVALIVATPASSLDVMIALYEDGRLVDERDDLSAAKGEAETHIYVGPAGQFTLVLTGFASSEGGYDVVVTTAELRETP